MILRVIAGAAFIALLVAGWLILNDEENAPLAAQTAASPVPNPGYSARVTKLVETGLDGRPMYTLYAATIDQQPASQLTVLQKVTFEFRDPMGHVWNGRADQGTVVDGATQIDLSGAVKIWGLLPSSEQPISLSSDRLALDTRTEIVTTKDPVLVEWSGQRLEGRGLVAHLREQRVKVESDVRGTYQP